VSEEGNNRMKTRKCEADSAGDKTHAARTSAMLAEREVILNKMET
jgi:hypothetical protein